MMCLWMPRSRKNSRVVEGFAWFEHRRKRTTQKQRGAPFMGYETHQMVLSDVGSNYTWRYSTLFSIHFVVSAGIMNGFQQAFRIRYDGKRL